MNRILTLSAASLLLSASASAATWQIDTAHSHLGFKVRHMTVSWVDGEFHDFSGTVEYDPAKPDATTANITAQMASIDTDQPKRDAHLISPDFFDATKYPTMTFTSSKVQSAAGDTLQVTGDLTMHGVTKPVVLQVEGLGQPVADPWGNYRVGATVTGTINRQDFGVSWNDTLDSGGVVVGDDVKLVIEVELTRPIDDSAKH
ncbi:MAG: polyisoprenoid-binding protein [Oligoflexia bacterium]|nr:polyisoprenoid-binding protein [Oligoflexia bacterium]